MSSRATVLTEATPRIRELLRSGRSLSTADTAHVEELIGASNERLQDNYRKMYRLTKSIDQLEEQQNLFCSLFAPIRKLPPEALSLIFSYAISKNRFSNIDKSWSNASFLCLVCHHWREVALSTPQIWGRIALEVDVAVGCSPYIVEYLKTHLERAQSTLLAVELTVTSNERHVHHLCTDATRCLLSTLFEHSNRWRSLILATSGGISAFCVAETILENGLGSLQSLALGVHVTEGGDENVLDLLRNHTPNLIAMNLKQYTSVDVLRQTTFPFSQITRLYLYTTPKGAVHSFEVCPQVVDIHIVVGAATPSLLRSLLGTRSDESDSDSESISRSQTEKTTLRRVDPHILPHLQSLTIEVKNGGSYESDRPFYHVGKILNAICAPSLSSLSFVSDTRQSQSVYDKDEFRSYGEPVNSRFLSALTDFFARNDGQHGRVLKEFHTIGIPFIGRDLLVILKKVPCLRALTVQEASAQSGDWNDRNVTTGWNKIISDEFLEALTCTTSSPLDTASTEASSISNGDTDGHSVETSTASADQNAVGNHKKYILRQLKNLSLTVHKDWKGNVFERMIESRAKCATPSGVQPLEAVSLKVLRELWQVDIQRLRKVQKAGLAISIREGEESRGEIIKLGYKVYSHTDEHED
ncbi:hypothetical protein VNI00_006822 [Paramarasmius palmivorus]|uniref:F-box domain-containing protein n=1 Tax=Paramarasmius palmivorus TaxID=297713 RepID=A0AAW0D9R6_9AGAR